jgi:hypothetical protein
MHDALSPALHAGAIVALLSLASVLGLATVAQGDTPYAKLRSVPFRDVHLSDAFWAPRIQTDATVTLPHELRMCEETDRIGRFAQCAGLAPGKPEGYFFNDSDTYKVIEGAAYCLALRPDPEMEKRIDGIIDLIAAAQQPDGYLNTFITCTEPDKRWADLPSKHELYCAGHLFEAAVAYHQATGKRKLLDVAIRFADYIDSVFGPGKREGVCGHEEIELALVKLAEETGESRYFHLAQYFIDARGKSGAEYCQDHKPVREQDTVVGHAVRAMYLWTAVGDVVARTGDQALLSASEKVWRDLVDRKLYITGGTGPSSHNEGFTDVYDLPNDSAYAETCAAIGLVLWGQRMLNLHATREYADVIEQALYNGVVSGISLSGDGFFYANPLASRGGHHRVPWFGCACCPPNILRLVASVGGYFYGTSPGAAWVHLYGSGETTVAVPDGPTVKLTQTTQYPWDGEIRIRVGLGAPARLSLYLRIPGWCESATYAVGGGAGDARPEANGYLRIEREWSDGDEVTLKLPMPVRRMAAHPAVAADRGRVALARGPIVYCLEAADNDGSVRSVYLPREAALEAHFEPDLLGGVTVIEGEGARVAAQDWRAGLYLRAAETTPATLRAIPYCDWDNRAPGEMVVWIPESATLCEQKLPDNPGTHARFTASHVHANPAAVNDGAIPGSSGDTAGGNFDWWDRKSTEEWAAYEFRRPVSVSGVEVYWFDDTGRGECRVPESWSVEWLDGETWRPVQASVAYGVLRDAFNVVTFPTVTTRSLRLKVKLANGVSAGIHEWRVLEPR